MKICLVSDLHFEINEYAIKNKDFKEADVLIIAGDLTCARFFQPQRTDAEARKHRNYIKRLSDLIGKKYDACFYVVGNHEHYGSIYKDTVPNLMNFLADTNITLLQDNHVTFNNVKFYGTSLWTSFNNGDFDTMNITEHFMNDYRWISKKHEDEIPYSERKSALVHLRNGTITPEFILNEHVQQLGRLNYFLENNKDEKIVVITHHAPSLKAQNTKRHGTNLMYAYCSDLDYIMEEYDNIALWCYGHTHDSMDFQVNKTRVISNQMGYWGNDPGAYNFKPVIIEI